MQNSCILFIPVQSCVKTLHTHTVLRQRHRAGCCACACACACGHLVESRCSPNFCCHRWNSIIPQIPSLGHGSSHAGMEATTVRKRLIPKWSRRREMHEMRGESLIQSRVLFGSKLKRQPKNISYVKKRSVSCAGLRLLALRYAARCHRVEGGGCE